MITVKDLHKKYGDHPVLNGLNIEFPKGKVISLIGGNGAGKSTLLSVISKLIDQDKGQITLSKEDITNISHKDFAKRLSFLRQSNFTHIRLKVHELVAFGRFPYNRGKKMSKEDKQKVEEAITFMELDNIANSYLDELSGGQRQRAYLAMILAQDTENILLDEPLNNLDMKYSVQIMKTLKKFARKQGKTVILIVHDINIASQYSDYIAALKDGVVQHFGTTDEIIKPRILKDIFDIDFEVILNRGCKFCLYYN